MDPYIQVVAFLLIAWLFRGSRTYQVLFAASAINLILYFSTSESTLLLAVIYSFVDTVTALFLFKFADRLKWFQISLLSCAAVINFLMHLKIMSIIFVFWYRRTANNVSTNADFFILFHFFYNSASKVNLAV